MDPPKPHFMNENSRFRGNSSSNSPSLKTGSTKSKRSFAISGLLLSSRQASKASPLPNSKPGQASASLPVTTTGRSASPCAIRQSTACLHFHFSASRGTATSASPAVSGSTSRPRNLFRTILKPFHSPAQPVAPRRPQVNVPSPAAQVALRERGLLPPLAPNKDLSEQEAEQDRRLAVVPLGTGPDHTDAGGLTAAHRIKQQWEVQNRAAELEQRKRLSTFKFGGASPTPPSPALTVSSYSSDPVVALQSTADPPSPPDVLVHTPPSPRKSLPAAIPHGPLGPPLTPLSPSNLEPIASLSASPSPSSQAEGVSHVSPHDISFSASPRAPEAASHHMKPSGLPPSPGSNDHYSTADPSSNDTAFCVNTLASAGNSIKAPGVISSSAPVIVESAREHATIFERADANRFTSMEKIDERDASPFALPGRGLARHTTDSAAGRKSKQNLKRNASNVSALKGNSKGLSSSLSTLRRSIVGTLSRGSRSRAPTGSVPVNVAEQMRAKSPSLNTRQAVNPRMHNEGTILMETANIEDEESRRMTELAFLG